MKDGYAHNQLIKLGDMMGDGLHHEPGGSWIKKEYNRALRAAEPEIFSEIRKKKADAVDKQMATLLQNNKCVKCGGELEQRRKGTKVCYCKSCGTRHMAQKKKR